MNFRKWSASAVLVLLSFAPAHVFGQNTGSQSWSSLSTFEAQRPPRYGLLSQSSLSENVDGNDVSAPPPAGAQPVSNPFAPRPVSEVFNAPAPTTCASCAGAAPSCIPQCCGPGWSPIAFVESTFFWPQISNMNTFAGTGSSTSSGPLDQQATQANDPFLVGPRLTFGAQGARWGVLGRFWYLSNWGNSFSPTDASSGTGGFLASNAFQLYIADLSLQRRWSGRRWNFWGFGGLAYGSVNINNRDTVTEYAYGYALSSTAYSAQRFNGTGITFGGYGTRALGNSPFKLFFANRYSVLWGTSHADAQAATSYVCTTMPSSSDASGMSSSRVGDMFIAELQLGTQWERQLVWFPGRAFVRTALEWQYWNAGGNVCAQAESESDHFHVVSAACANADSILFNMLGFNLGGGILY